MIKNSSTLLKNSKSTPSQFFSCTQCDPQTLDQYQIKYFQLVNSKVQKISLSNRRKSKLLNSANQNYTVRSSFVTQQNLSNQRLSSFEHVDQNIKKKNQTNTASSLILPPRSLQILQKQSQLECLNSNYPKNSVNGQFIKSNNILANKPHQIKKNITFNYLPSVIEQKQQYWNLGKQKNQFIQKKIKQQNIQVTVEHLIIQNKQIQYDNLNQILLNKNKSKVSRKSSQESGKISLIFSGQQSPLKSSKVNKKFQCKFTTSIKSSQQQQDKESIVLGHSYGSEFQSLTPIKQLQFQSFTRNSLI